MTELISDLNFTYWTWFIAMLVFFGLEMVMPGVVFLWLGIAAAATGSYVWLLTGHEWGLLWEGQIVLFSLLSIVSIFAGRRFIKARGNIPSDNETLNRRGDAMIGNSYPVAVTIKNGHGKIKVGDSLWIATGEDADENSMVTVVSVDGTTLHTKPQQ